MPTSFQQNDRRHGSIGCDLSVETRMDGRPLHLCCNIEFSKSKVLVSPTELGDIAGHVLRFNGSLYDKEFMVIRALTYGCCSCYTEGIETT